MRHEAMRRHLLFVPLLAGAPLLAGWADPRGDHGGGFGGITVADVESHLLRIATASLEGRDSPSVGLSLAGDYIIDVFTAAGLEGAGPDGTFRIPFSRNLRAPKKESCALSATLEGGEQIDFRFGKDFIPLPVCTGEATGKPVFVGFGIRSKKHKYDDLKGKEIDGNIAVLLAGEPRHKRKFEGTEVTPEADVHVKVKNLEQEGAIGVLVVRRSRPRDKGTNGDGPAAAELGFRYTWAGWNATTGQNGRAVRIGRSYRIPVLEVTEDVAGRILGEDLVELGASLDKRVRPVKSKPKDVTVSLRSEMGESSVPIDNIVGIIRGTDPELADEYVVVGAHYDHVGVDQRGRIGFGADDNGSGTVGMLEIVQALAAAGPRRSVLACAFAGEEDGLDGSRELCRNLPVPRESIVAMINLDMIGRGKTSEVVVLGTEQNPELEDVLKRARKLKNARVKIITGKAKSLWQRSDHFSFHQIGVPVLFFFEAESLIGNKDYHTWRDTIDELDLEKIARTARIVYNTVWILSEDDERPPPPRD
ncbi:MAG: M20/M25/M40 family metallo-hydrolase [Planctomycetota bacterium]|nr:M20/M25/M40 family metallo-hydrolase [Planctomycetota bacterium]